MPIESRRSTAWWRRRQSPVPERSVRIVFVSGPDAETLQSMGRVLVEEGLAACVNVFPGITSVYRWEGETRVEPECMAMIKTTEGCVQAVRLRVADLHPYDVPEFVAVKVAEGSPAYLRWVRESVTDGSGDGEA
ncbi:MAG: divalent-cation tolerance protein CutA [Gemmatimonadetes bacterium]|nr:divalent-cation tolerance protein CutA [Gemmatimonadota bacterium]